LDTIWLDFREDRCERGVAVAFERRIDALQRVVARVSAPIDTEQIAAAMEDAIHLPPATHYPTDVNVRLVHHGIAFSVESARLARVGAALLERAGRIL
jgi:hypothetical protein